MTQSRGRPAAADRNTNARWFKDAIFYELRVRSMYDSNGDGIGDFPGLTAKLDYLRDLGITTLWLLPFYPSPMRDDGYDIADYMAVHPDCGTLDDFVRFLNEAHRRGLRVVTELVINHTSDQHPWFQRARRAPAGSPERDFYVWSDTAERYRDARIIFKDFELSNWCWDPIAKAYFWHRFYAHQPDLNFDNPAVHDAVFKVVDFWLDLGVDGLRLDAVPYLYEREGTSCENLPETHGALRNLRRHIDERYDSRMLLAEANQWPEDAVAYFDEGKACHMAFHFPIMPRMFMALRAEDRFPITDIWSQTPPIPDTCQWALFLRNHDELTLEMVTDEERDYMYRAYARERRMRINLGIRRRLAPLLGNDRRSIELMNALLFSLPGTPVVYYGDEIGMGDNVYLGDRDGVRTPMQWSADLNAGFSRANPQQLILPVIIDHEYHYHTVNVEAQEKNRHSLLWWTRRLIAIRKQHLAFGRGTIDFLNPENARILAFVRRLEDENILVVANLSRFAQHVEIDLSAWKGAVPRELFGHTEFPPIGDRPYALTLGPHMFLWFELCRETGRGPLDPGYHRPTLEVSSGFGELVFGTSRHALEQLVAGYLSHWRVLGPKARQIKSVSIAESIQLSRSPDGPALCLVEVEYQQGEPDTCLLPLSFVPESAALTIRDQYPERILAELVLGNSSQELRAAECRGVLCDGVADPTLASALLDVIDGRKALPGSSGGQLAGTTTDRHAELRGPRELVLEPRLVRSEQSNSSVVLGERLILKVYRRLEDGINPDLEVGQVLGTLGFPHTPHVAGAIEIRRPGAEPRTLAVAHAYVRNEGDAWQYTRAELRRYFERAATRWALVKDAVEAPLPNPFTPMDTPHAVVDMIGAYLDVARLLGSHVAALHLALASSREPEFTPEPYTSIYQRSVYQSMRNATGTVLRALQAKMGSLPPEVRPRAEQVLSHRDWIDGVFQTFYRHRVTAQRMRFHGNLHLGHWLYTGRDFVLIDFEGDASRPISDRRRKRSSLRDIACMLRSWHYAAFGTLHELRTTGALGSHPTHGMAAIARFWQAWISWAFVHAYLDAAKGASFLPTTANETAILLDAFTLERAIVELGHELTRRPDWAYVPVEGIHQVLDRLHGT